MSVLVSKFGGSSMADANGFRRVRALIFAPAQARFIVLSAPGRRHCMDDKVTDLLLLAHARTAEGGDNRLILSAIRARYEEIADALSIPMDGLFDSLAADAAFSRDRAAAQGERLCAMLFARYAGLPFVDAAELIHFDARGRVDAAKTRAAVQKMARRYSCAVIPGFYGSRPDGEIQTFSRGGSDISGAWIAAALGASLYENWTDVDGLMSADPTLCPDAAAHPLVSYRQMARLSAAGAQVLHPDCLRPVRDAGVPTVIRNTFRPERPGTCISDCVCRVVPCVCALDDRRLIPMARIPEPLRGTFRESAHSRFFAPDGAEMLVASGGAVSLISAFSPDAAALERARQAVPALAISEEEHCVRLAVPAEEKAAAVREIHAHLTAKAGA